MREVVLQVTNNKHFTARRLSLHFRRRSPGCWVVACGPVVSCSAWDSSCLVVGRGQAATYTAALTGHQVNFFIVSPLELETKVKRRFAKV